MHIMSVQCIPVFSEYAHYERAYLCLVNAPYAQAYRGLVSAYSECADQWLVNALYERSYCR